MNWIVDIKIVIFTCLYFILQASGCMDGVRFADTICFRGVLGQSKVLYLRETACMDRINSEHFSLAGK